MRSIGAVAYGLGVGCAAIAAASRRRMHSDLSMSRTAACSFSQSTIAGSSFTVTLTRPDGGRGLMASYDTALAEVAAYGMHPIRCSISATSPATVSSSQRQQAMQTQQVSQ